MYRDSEDTYNQRQANCAWTWELRQIKRQDTECVLIRWGGGSMRKVAHLQGLGSKDGVFGKGWDADWTAADAKD